MNPERSPFSITRGVQTRNKVPVQTFQSLVSHKSAVEEQFSRFSEFVIREICAFLSYRSNSLFPATLPASPRIIPL